MESAGTRETDRQFAGSIPETYDRYLGPLLFEPYARDLAARLAALAPARVLETAAGTGVATRALARALPAGAAIVATDLNRPMLDLAAARMETAEVTWQQADALALPFEDGAFDAVACQFGAMFFPDKAAAYREARRVLRRGGRLRAERLGPDRAQRAGARGGRGRGGAVPGGPAPVPGPRAATATTTRTRSSTSCGRPGSSRSRSRRWRGAAGRPRRCTRRSGFCQGTPLRAEIEARAPGRLGGVTDAAARAVAARFGDGPVDSGMQAHVIVATR